MKIDTIKDPLSQYIFLEPEMEGQTLSLPLLK